MTSDGAAFLKKEATNTARLRERAIAEYHELLLCDKTLAPRVFEKLHNAMRTNRLVYGDRPISVALRPHFLERLQFEVHTAVAELVASRMESTIPHSWVGMVLCVKAGSIIQWDVRKISYSKSLGRCLSWTLHAPFKSRTDKKRIAIHNF